MIVMGLIMARAEELLKYATVNTQPIYGGIEKLGAAHLVLSLGDSVDIGSFKLVRHVIHCI